MDYFVVEKIMDYLKPMSVYVVGEFHCNKENPVFLASFSHKDHLQQYLSKYQIDIHNFDWSKFEGIDQDDPCECGDCEKDHYLFTLEEEDLVDDDSVSMVLTEPFPLVHCFTVNLSKIANMLDDSGYKNLDYFNCPGHCEAKIVLARTSKKGTLGLIYTLMNYMNN